MSTPTESAEVEVIPLVEEQVRLEKRSISKRKVRVKTVFDSLEEVVRAYLKDESVEITRVPIGRAVDSAPEIRTEGDVTIIPVLQEVVVVEKRLVLTEELHIRRRTETETVEIPVTLRKQRVVIERSEDARDSTQNQDKNDEL